MEPNFLNREAKTPECIFLSGEKCAVLFGILIKWPVPKGCIDFFECSVGFDGYFR
jgi:hypothetical protein